MKVRITVIKKMNIRDIYGDSFPYRVTARSKPECSVFNVGDEFVAEDDDSCPAGFCGWAWADIQRDVWHLLFGGDYPWMEDKGVNVVCCTDGRKPVFFKLERIE